MKRRLETLGYVLCFQLARLRVDHGRPWGWLESLWTGIWYRYYCPYPIGGKWRACACVETGQCGCENQKYYRLPDTPLTCISATDER